MKRNTIVCSVLILLSPCYAASQEDNSNIIAIKNVTIIPVVGEDIAEGHIVIKDAGITVIFGSLYALPPQWEDGYDSLYRNPVIDLLQ